MAAADVSVASVEEAQDLLCEGKRDLLVGDVSEALSNLASSCEIFAKVKGETALECAEPYFYYGKALLEMSRMESSVLGNALEGVDLNTKPLDANDELVEDTAAMTTDERGEIEDQVAVALEENFEKHDLVAKAHLGEEEELEDMEDDGIPDEMEVEEVEKADGEPGNLEQAWEMFELCKVIWSKAGNIAKECEALICLGEISLENEDFPRAIEDIAECLSKRVQALPADSRSIAETHYQLGVAQAQCKDFIKAEASLKSAITVLEARKSTVSKMDSSDNMAKELAELDMLVKEINARIVDHKEMEKGTYLEEKEFVPAFKGVADEIPASFIGVKPAPTTA